MENNKYALTWNHVTVHVQGKFQVLKDDEEIFRSLEIQIEKNEGKKGWKMPEDLAPLEQSRIWGLKESSSSAKSTMKWNKRRVVGNLEKGSGEMRKVAEYMKRLSF